MSDNPEIGRPITIDGIETNYHDVGLGRPVLFVHGSGPGVSATAGLRPT
jgi:2-hydroxymuconate-semialdehyde hydrolase